MAKQAKPRRKEGFLYFDLVVKEGNTPILNIKEKKLSALDEVIEMLKRKL